jgi:hypothetical protein
MALTPVQQVNLLIGNVPSNPFYPIFTDEEIQQFLDLTNQNVYAAARMAAISASFTIAGYSSRERTGDIEVWNDYAKNYLAALGNFINNPTFIIPPGLFPWSANKCPSKLMNIEVCDGDNCREATCCETSCGCNDCHAAGETFVYP